MSLQMEKSESLKSYGMLKPSDLNFLRSSSTAWNQQSEKTSFWYLLGAASTRASKTSSSKRL